MKTVWTNGCFDILHRGHIEMLAYARSLGGCLVVGIDSDQKVKRDKGLDRPFNNEEDRKAVLNSLKHVDEVVIFHTPQELERCIKRFRPTYMVVGSDWKDKLIIGSHFAKQVKYFERVGDYSTTHILERNNDMKKKTTPATNGITEAEAREVTSQMLELAFRDHARQMEDHLRDIDTRIKRLEGKR
jgi:rfaE bifunctional protein nucleotidyltransferase chain/domain